MRRFLTRLLLVVFIGGAVSLLVASDHDQGIIAFETSDCNVSLVRQAIKEETWLDADEYQFNSLKELREWEKEFDGQLKSYLNLSELEARIDSVDMEAMLPHMSKVCRKLGGSGLTIQNSLTFLIVLGGAVLGYFLIRMNQAKKSESS